MIANDSVTKELHRVESEIKKRDTDITNLVNGACFDLILSSISQ